MISFINSRKLLLALILVTLARSSISADEYDEYIIPGKWNIKGKGFGEYSPVRLQLKLYGDMDLTTSAVSELDTEAIISDDQTLPLDLLHLDGNMRALTGYTIHLQLNLTGASIKAWDEDFPNYIRIPILLPNMRPTANNPFVLPSVNLEKFRYKVSFTSTTTGKIRINGYTDVDNLGRCEINADCAIWKDGYPEPALEEETSSGCDSGISSLMLLLVFAGVRKFVRN